MPPQQLIGRTVERVEARAKHLLIRLSGGFTLHTHMRMTGAWHVYSAGERWRKPGWQARVVLEAGDRVAVCFNAPVVELLTERDEQEHAALQGLGPDVLEPPLDLAEVGRRAGALPPDTPIGDVLLDQGVVSGIGNIYRCEALFLCRTHPAAAWSDAPLDDLVGTASRVMAGRVAPSARPYQPWVYGRAGRPCRRCRTPIESARMGRDARTAYWCPSCQPPPPAVPPSLSRK